MPSVVDICNFALGNIRANSINSLAETSVEAQVCQQRYDQAVEFTLRDFPWNFAHKIEALALLGFEPHEWLYGYMYPSDCVTAKHIVQYASIANDRTIYNRFNCTSDEILNYQQISQKRIPYEVGNTPDDGRAIFTNEPNAQLAYTALITDPNEFPPDFVEALSWYLAAMIAIPVVGTETGRELRKESLQIYMENTVTARANNANESWNTSTIPESPTITARK